MPVLVLLGEGVPVLLGVCEPDGVLEGVRDGEWWLGVVEAVEVPDPEPLELPDPDPDADCVEDPLEEEVDDPDDEEDDVADEEEDEEDVDDDEEELLWLADPVLEALADAEELEVMVAVLDEVAGLVALACFVWDGLGFGG